MKNFNENPQEQGSKGYIFCRCIIKNGRRIYPKKAQAFRIPKSKA